MSQTDVQYGILGPKCPLTEETGEGYDAVNAVNLRGVWTFLKHELIQMQKQGSGAIVNCSSLGGLVGLPGRAASMGNRLVEWARRRSWRRPFFGCAVPLRVLCLEWRYRSTAASRPIDQLPVHHGTPCGDAITDEISSGDCVVEQLHEGGCSAHHGANEGRGFGCYQSFGDG